MRIKLSKSDVFWSYAASITTLLGSVVMLFVVLLFLDQNQTSIWYVFSSIGGMTVLFDFGFSVTFARNITYCWSGARELLPDMMGEITSPSPNYSLMRNVIKSCKIIYMLISSTVLVGCLTIGSAYIGWLSRDVHDSTIMIAWFVYATAMFLNLYYGYYSSFLRGVGAVDLANKNTTYGRLIQIALMVCLLVLGCGIVGASIAYLAYGFVFRRLCKRDFYNYEDIGAKLSSVGSQASANGTADIVKIVWHNAWREGAISLSAYLCTQASTLVSSMFFSLTDTGIYSLSLQIATMVANIGGTLYVASEPSLQEAWATRDYARTKQIMGLVVTATIYSCAALTLCVVVFAPPFVHIIKPEYVLSRDVLLVLCLYQSMLKFRDCYATYFSCSNRVPYVFSYCICAILGIVASVFALRLFGSGILLFIFAQALPQLSWNMWVWPLRAHREMSTSLRSVIVDGTGQIKKSITRMASAIKR